MSKKQVFVTGTTGTMGGETMKRLLERSDRFHVVTLARDSEKNRKYMERFAGNENLTIYWGDLTCYEDVLKCMKNVDYVIHCAAFVSPEADLYPKEAMKINYGGTMNIINAILEQPNKDEIKLVNIGTVAETGDRMAPIHWGRVGDPLKPSVHDYYAVSKIAAERAVIESGLKYWVSLRQTGILSIKEFTTTTNGIYFHQPLNNVLEWVTDYDSGVLCANACEDWVSEDFWGHVYNIGGGESCRLTFYELANGLMKCAGIDDIRLVSEPNWYATHNFHGQWYLDSDKLEEMLKFRSHSAQDFFAYYAKYLQKEMAEHQSDATPTQEQLIQAVRQQNFNTALSVTGPMNWLLNNMEEMFNPFFISKSKWSTIPGWDKFVLARPSNDAIVLDHGYDEFIPENELTTEEIKKAAEFRGGKCLADQMVKGDWQTKLPFECHCGHRFEASPRLILEAGYWCDHCERESWNYAELAKHSPFFAQVWEPLHDADEVPHAYKKTVSEPDVNC